MGNLNWQKVRKSIFTNILIIFFVVLLVGFWQTKDLPRDTPSALNVMTLDHQTVTLIDSDVKKVRLIYFFASWCGVCRLSMPNLEILQKWFPWIEVKGVALDYESIDEIKSFIRETEVGVPVFMGDAEFGRHWSIASYPTYFVVDSKGVIRASSVGYSSLLGMVGRTLWATVF